MAAIKREPKQEAPIHGDVLETIFSFVPLIDLVPSCHVSKSWNKTVFSSLTHVRQIKPWLIVLPQTSRASRVTIAHAYDPRSHAWLQITKHQPLINKTQEIPAIRSSHSTLLYTLSPSEFTFSLDALQLEWHKAPSPRVWRTDPIVARVGNCVVVAGGACEFEDDPLAVEMYNMESRDWVNCQSMPMTLKTSSASSWLSVAVVGETMLVTEKNSGVTYTFNTTTMDWEGPYYLRPDDKSVLYTVTGTLSEKLTVAGLVGEPGNVREVKLWAVKEEIDSGMEEIGSMPKEMVEKLRGDSEFGSVEAIWVGNLVYLRNTLVLDELVVCEVVNGNLCEWRSVKNAAVDGGTRMVFCGGDVKMEDLQRAVLSEKQTFSMKQM
ncbi:putative F-box domain, kelch-type beta propeller [Medicago truncatula]|uniref:F-box/kelch-repeat plant protein n=1 Tax=Medicago truncatula TaxID=3880 RepID=G7K074_MEDTR|nr:F-box/kelch-repeat protein At1g23390 [Medicago truncatula]AES96155.2 F-box/kelch-repeat plant protein [Medicago truncatula]RHN55030.1 putative F-box domain, kelch-type beta propeller [Medicago truncatula]